MQEVQTVMAAMATDFPQPENLRHDLSVTALSG